MCVCVCMCVYINCCIRVLSRKEENISRDCTEISCRFLDLNAHFKQRIRKFCFYFLVMNESTNYQDTGQLLFIIWGVNKKFDIREELGIQLITNHITQRDFFNGVIKWVNEKLEYDLRNLVAIFFKDAFAIWWENIRAVSVVSEFVGRWITIHHCILHKQVLCC